MHLYLSPGLSTCNNKETNWTDFHQIWYCGVVLRFPDILWFQLEPSVITGALPENLHTFLRASLALIAKYMSGLNYLGQTLYRKMKYMSNISPIILWVLILIKQNVRTWQNCYGMRIFPNRFNTTMTHHLTVLQAVAHEPPIFSHLTNQKEIAHFIHVTRWEVRKLHTD
jgi:hypothetical protein